NAAAVYLIGRAQPTQAETQNDRKRHREGIGQIAAETRPVGKQSGGWRRHHPGGHRPEPSYDADGEDQLEDEPAPVFHSASRLDGSERSTDAAASEKFPRRCPGGGGTMLSYDTDPGGAGHTGPGWPRYRHGLPRRRSAGGARRHRLRLSLSLRGRPVSLRE